MVRKLVIIGLIIVPWFCWWYGRPHAQLSMLDVGQGLSVLVEDETGWQLLFDGGPDDSVMEQLGESLPPTDHSLDLVVISHQHRDHFVGAIAVLQRYQVGELWITKEDSTDPAWQLLLATAQERHVPLSVIKEGTVRYLSSSRKITVYHPPATPLGNTAHDYSAVLTVSGPGGAGTEITLTGDAEVRHEEYIAHCQTSIVLACPTTGAILQAGHHGSKTSTGQGWLEQLQPSEVWISVGAGNTYGHPNSEVLERLQQNQIPFRRTDLDGTIKLDLKGQKT